MLTMARAHLTRKWVEDQVMMTVGLADPSAGHDGQSLYIQPSRAEQAYLTGQSFFVTCFLGADVDRQQVMWRDPEGRPITENEGRIHVYRRRDEPEGIQLVVEEVQMGDAGLYTCSTFAGPESRDVSVSFTLFVYRAITFQGTKDIQTGTEGDEKAVIRCEADAHHRKLEFSWQLNGRAIRNFNNKGNNGKYKVEGQVLTIYNVETTDAGNYTCSAFMGTKHLVSVQKKMIQFIVQYRPRFKDTTLDTRYARVGSLAKIPCEAEGEPQPSIKWLRGMEHLYAREDYTIVGNVGTSVLNIDVRDHSYYGVYTCHAQNELGPSEKAIELLEGGAPVAPRVRVVEPDRPKKDTIVLHIEHDEDDMNNDLAVHTFRVQYKTDEGTWETAPSEEYQLNDRHPQYELRRLNTNTSYVIRVAAKNAAGYSDFSQELYHRTQNMDYQRAPVAVSSQLFASTLPLFFPLILLRQRL
ncbi:neural cell adhesion molecule 1-A-like isoform X2 [Varroa destructor]|uniref:Uncharacterized protein n=1 Tax=Varroa destructor TaxID=109461 RepID=A0A7M7MB30_VARDE|nr:neural cell adhesion molecule 1-A-like isoform X2 [Varroa destructor]